MTHDVKDVWGGLHEEELGTIEEQLALRDLRIGDRKVAKDTRQKIKP